MPRRKTLRIIGIVSSVLLLAALVVGMIAASAHGGLFVLAPQQNGATGGKGASQISASGPPGQFSCTPPPAGMVAWYPGDGNASDIQGGNNGTANGGVSFVPAKVAEGFQTSNGGFVRAPDSPALRPSMVTADAWIKRTGSPGSYRYIISKSLDGGRGSYAFFTGGSGGIFFYVAL
ncbi:MAG: hypothetical protein ACR2LC_01795 [Pyrinomonadaceae bacterium]